MRVLLTGMSGTGKSTVLAELRRRGHTVLDTDDDGWVLPSGQWDAERMEALLTEHQDIVVSGCVDNQADFYHRFTHVILLSAPADVMFDRVRTRKTNPYGRTAEQRAEILGYLETVQPLLRQSATIELDGREPIPALASTIEALMAQVRPRRFVGRDEITTAATTMGWIDRAAFRADLDDAIDQSINP